MPRQSRIDAPGAIHHVIIRGIERRMIFQDNSDQEAFLDRLGKILTESSTSCYAWSLLGNHAHFLFRTGMFPISRLMRKLLTGYAVSFNRRHGRHGHLFQNRYKSILCEEDIYLKELVRYIHLNPLRAKMVGNLDELGAYAYSGHSVLMGEQKRDFQDRDYILDLFGKRERDAKKKYLLFVSKGIEEGKKPELTGGGLIRSVGGWKRLKDLRESGQRVNSDERILGGSEFVERVLMEANEEWERKALIKKSGIDLDSLLEKVRNHFCVDVKELKSGSRSRDIAKARSVLCCLGVRNLGLTCVTMAKALGVSPSAVSKSIVRGRNILQVEDIEDKLMKSQ